MQRIGVLYNPLSAISVEHSLALEVWLKEHGFIPWRGTSQEYRDNPHVLQGMDLLVAMGGDGTVLRAARVAYHTSVPVLPVALGTLSFMAEIGPEEVYSGIELLHNGGGWYDERTVASAVLRRKNVILERFIALNEVVVSRSDMSRVVNAEVEIDGWPLTTYHADGILVATATGSTAYALAAGGPMVDPRSKALLLVGIAAHLTNIPSMVLHEDTVVTIKLRSRHHAMLAVDGRENLPLEQGDEVEIRRSEHYCVIAHVRPASHFYSNLARRLRRSE
jgi:NAD+ kinase